MNLEHNSDPFVRLDRIKDAIFEAAQEVRDHRNSFACTHTEGHIHFALCALRGLEQRNHNMIIKAGKGSDKAAGKYVDFCSWIAG